MKKCKRNSPTWNRFVCAGSRRKITWRRRRATATVHRRRRRFDFFLFFATTLLVSQDLDRLCFCPMYPKTDVRRLQKKGGAGTVLTFFFATPLLVSLDLDRLSFYPNESKIDFRLGTATGRAQF